MSKDSRLTGLHRTAGAIPILSRKPEVPEPQPWSFTVSGTRDESGVKWSGIAIHGVSLLEVTGLVHILDRQGLPVLQPPTPQPGGEGGGPQ